MGMSRMKHVMTDLSDKLESLNLRLPIRITDTFSMSLPEAEGIKKNFNNVPHHRDAHTIEMRTKYSNLCSHANNSTPQ